MAYYLQLSPIFVNFVLGVVLMNLGRHSDHVESRLISIRRPLYILLFFFAGAGWALDAP
jgi:Kef-type K+ transport system membrane component KefB